MKKKLAVIASGVVISALVVLIGLAMWARLAHGSWHQFEPAKDDAPQAFVQLKPDYAYHIGDLLPVTVYIKQQTGTKVDIDGLVMTGDFEVVSKSAGVKQKTDSDGSVRYRLDLVLQSLEAKPARQFSADFSWTSEATQETKLAKLPVTTMYGSNTWDGRDKLQEGDPIEIPSSWLVAQHVVALVLSAVIFLFLARVSLRDWSWRRALSEEEKLQERLLGIWARIERGETAVANYEQIEQIIRACWKIESLLPSAVPSVITDVVKARTLQIFLELSNRAVYSTDKLNAEENDLLKSLSVTLLQSAFAVQRLEAEDEQLAKKTAS